jgi:hypothetical protein
MDKTKSIYDNDIVSGDKFTGSKWSCIEKPLEELERKINEMIINYNNDNESVVITSNQPVIIGEIYYRQIRDRLKKGNKLIFCDIEKINDENIIETEIEKKKRIKNEEDILKKLQKELQKSTVKVKLESISNNLSSKIDDLEETLSSITKDTEYKDVMRKHCYLEFKILILMKIIQNTINSKNSNEKDIDELILGAKKILSTLKSNKTSNNYKKICKIEHVNIEICDLLLNDLENNINKLLKIKNVHLYDVANRNPRLIYETIYDLTLQNNKFKLHDSQKELMNTIKDNFDNGFLILYKTLPGLGKTSMISSVCTFAKQLNKEMCLNTGKKTIVLFCCSDILESVRLQVLRVAFSFKIKFGIAVASKDKEKYKIVNSWNCSDIDERNFIAPELIAADYASTLLILEENNNKYNYILFFDEPTFLTDNEKNTGALHYLSKILYYLPKHTILSSATLPNKEDIGTIINDYKEKYKDSKIKEIISNKTLTGCFIKDFNSNIIVPHSYCKNIDELEKLVNKIRNNPLLGKFYTLPFLLNFNNFCNENNIGLDFDKIENFEHDKVLENILLLFDRFIELNKTQENKDVIFNNFINIKVNDINEEELDLNKLDNEYDKVIFNKLLTKHAYKYIGCCLIAADDPLEFVKENFYETVEKIKKTINLDSINKYYKSYKDKMEDYNKKLDYIEKKFKSEEVVDERIEKLKAPVFIFNRSIEINTPKHISSFSKYVTKYDSDLLKKEIEFENIDITEYTDIDDNLKLLLYMGVGLFSKSLNEEYTTKVLELMSEKKLAYLIADESFCYGANYQIKNVIIPDSFGNIHSINTILQLMGRTSRMGKSWAGKVYLDKYTAIKIKNYFLSSKDDAEEAININNAYNKIKREILNENNKITKIIKPKINRNIHLESKFVKLETSTSNKCLLNNNEKVTNENINNNEIDSIAKTRVDIRNKLITTNSINNIPNNNNNNMMIFRNKLVLPNSINDNSINANKFNNNEEVENNNYNRENNNYNREDNNYNREDNNYNREDNNYNREDNNYNRENRNNREEKNNAWKRLKDDKITSDIPNDTTDNKYNNYTNRNFNREGNNDNNTNSKWKNIMNKESNTNNNSSFNFINEISSEKKVKQVNEININNEKEVTNKYNKNGNNKKNTLKDESNPFM